MVFEVLVVAAIAGGAVYSVFKYNAAARVEWAKIARALGLELSPHSTVLSGQVYGHSVTVARHYDGESSFIQVRVGARLPRSINIKPSGVRKFADLGATSEVTTGDEVFDAAARVTGEEVFVLAALSWAGRSAVRGLFAANGYVEEGDVIVCSPSRAQVPGDVRKAIYVADVLAFDREAPGERLLDNLQLEHVSTARLRCLEAFRSVRVSSSSRERAIQIGLKHDDPRLRAEAAMRCGPTAVHFLEAIAIDPIAPDELRARLLDHLQELERLPAMEKCVAMLERAGPRTTIALLGLMAKKRDARAEARAIALLAHADVEVQMAAVKTLAELGTAAAVEPLTELGGILDRELKREAARAAAKIRTRLGEIDPGRLSIASEEAEHGGLSFAEREGGTLGIVDPKQK